MNDWQYPPLGELEKNNFSPKLSLEVFLWLNVEIWSRDDQKLKMKEIGELVAFLREDQHN